jgi:TetR/AcrR family transcriptional regulator
MYPIILEVKMQPIMNNRFFKLPKEKQLRIINAALEVFSKSEYKRASTDDIAAKAGISKGLLFYYFHNKKELYLFLFKYCTKLVHQRVIDDNFMKICDFFEILDYAAEKKMSLFLKMPYIMDFWTKAFYSKDEPVSEDMQKEILKKTEFYSSLLNNQTDQSKFKPGVSPGEIMKMLTWMTDGYLREKLNRGININADELMRDYRKWSDMFRKMAYKEEYLYEDN